MGIFSEILDPNEAQKKFPLLDPSVFKMALYVPEDGTIDPTTTCNALIKVAKKHGGKVCLLLIKSGTCARFDCGSTYTVLFYNFLWESLVELLIKILRV